MENEKGLKCDSNCCVRNLVLLYEGEEFRKYLEYHVANYRLHKRDVSITLQEVHSLSSSSSSNVFEHSIISKGESLLDHVNGIDDMGSSSLPSWDGVVFPAHMTGALQESNRLWDWTSYLLQQQKSENDNRGSKFNIEWMDIQPYFRSQAQQVEEKSTGGASSPFPWMSSNGRDTDDTIRRTLYVPLDGDAISLYYRKDLFEKHQMKVPRTWDDYRDVATFFHGKPWGPNNTTLTGSCVAQTSKTSSDDEKNMHAHWASLVLSTMTQTKGTSSGFLLDPETAEPILGDAMEETLRILAQESTLSESDGYNDNNDNNNDGSNDFPDLAWRLNGGSCAMTYSWSNQLTTTMNGDYEKLNNIGVAATPGSELVLNRTTGHLETCTPELCPYGTYYDDIGIVNRPSYSAFGGWVGGVSNDSTSSKQHDMADFFSYISNPVQSLSDALPNERSHFVSPFRYSHVAASNWVGAGFDEVTALQYTETIQLVNSENTVSDIRIRPGTAIREIIDQEVNAYLMASHDYERVSLNASDSFEDTVLRSETTASMDRRIRDAIASLDTKIVIKNYQSSLGFPEGYNDVSMNYIDTNYRDTGWGVAALICFSSIAMVFWILWNRKKPVMQAFQPILLIQTAMGFFFMGATLVPLGFDDSLYSKDMLDITCMATPWIYIFGYTVFFSSVYSKIQVCTEIYKNPGTYERMVVQPIDSLKLFCKLFVLNGVLLFLWTYTDPLRWSRIEKIKYGSAFSDGTVESYGTCKTSTYPVFAIALCVCNLLCCFVAMLQALRCRLLVLEYREMQWLQLCIVPFFEAWIVGGPVVTILHDQPTTQYAACVIIVASSTIASAFAIFAPKEWYIRKNNDWYNGRKPETPPTSSPAGVRVLKHPKLESQKHVSRLQNRLVRYTSSNTELAIDIRILQEKFRLLTEKEKLAAVGGMYAKENTESQSSRMQTIMFERDEPSIPEKRGNTNRIETFETKCSNIRVSELSIDIDDLKQLRAEMGPTYSQTDDRGLFVGKSVRSIVELIESTTALSLASNEKTSEKSSGEITSTDCLQQITSTEVQSNNFVQGVGPGSETVPSYSSNEAEIPFDEVEDRTVESTPSKSNEQHPNLSDDIEDKTCGVTQTYGLGDEMDDLNQMIESDNIRDLQTETMMMAEEFKMRLSLLEGVSGIRSCMNEEELNQMIESDNIRDLESETMMMAEEFKSNNSFLESISDLQPCINEIVGEDLECDEYHTLDVSNGTATSTSTAITKNDGKVFAVSSDALIDPSSTSNRDSPETKAIASAGESSGGHVLAPGKTFAKKNEGNSRQQHAGEPSSDRRSPIKPSEDIATDKVGDGTINDDLNSLVHTKYEQPKTTLAECSSVSSSLSSTPSSVPIPVQVPVSVPVPAGLEPQFDTSHSSNNIKSSSIMINGWKPIGIMGSLLADVSDSTSSSLGESMSDSISSLEVMSTPRNSEVRMAKNIEKMLKQGFDSEKVGAENYEDGDSEEKNGTRDTKILNTRQKKRALEASFRSSSP